LFRPPCARRAISTPSTSRLRPVYGATEARLGTLRCEPAPGRVARCWWAIRAHLVPISSDCDLTFIAFAAEGLRPWHPRRPTISKEPLSRRLPSEGASWQALEDQFLLRKCSSGPRARGVVWERRETNDWTRGPPAVRSAMPPRAAAPTPRRWNRRRELRALQCLMQKTTDPLRGDQGEDHGESAI